MRLSSLGGWSGTDENSGAALTGSLRSTYSDSFRRRQLAASFSSKPGQDWPGFFAAAILLGEAVASLEP